MLRPGGGFLDRTITDADDKTAVPSITIEKNSIHYQFVRMLKLVESLAAKAKRARSTTVVFVPLGESVSHRCSWCGRFAKGTPKGWNGYRAVDHTYPRGLNVAGDVSRTENAGLAFKRNTQRTNRRAADLGRQRRAFPDWVAKPFRPPVANVRA